MWFNDVDTKPPSPPLPREESKNKVKCEWMACANNTSGLCSSKEVKLKSIKIDGVDYLNCDSFDFE